MQPVAVRERDAEQHLCSDRSRDGRPVAYEVLSSPVRRQAYDLRLSSGAAIAALDAAELNERMVAMLKAGKLAAALSLFMQLQSARPSSLRPETGAALLVLCVRRAHMRQAAYVYAQLRDANALRADSCNVWFSACMQQSRIAEAMDVLRFMEARGLEQSASVRACMRQIRAYRAATSGDEARDADTRP
jgi:pentatricopeptide repeat protein